MLQRCSIFAVLTALVLMGAPTLLDAAPRDTKVGDVRSVFSKQGTPLRASASTLGAATATLPYGTQVRVLEVKLPWIRVQTVAAPARTGWLRAFETVEPAALAGSPAPAHTTYRGGAGVTAREVSAAGRQLDAGTEQRYRTSRQDLVAAYRAVDAMEAETQHLDPAESIAFIMDGSLGRVGRDYARPGRVAPAAPRRTSGGRVRRGVGGFLGKLGGEVARRAGAGDTGSRVAESLIAGAADYLNQIRTKFTPQQEYYLGRAVAAQAIARYGLDPDPRRRRYVRLVGDAVVRLSSRLPANFGGYHFDVLNSDEVNAVSGPGGFVLITRGAVEAARTEGELAGVLSHELSHISRQHGERLLRQSKKFPTLVKGLAGAASAAAGASAWAQGLTQFFGQVVDHMSTTAINHGYGRALEFESDTEGTYILFDVYYDHGALKSFLGRLGVETHRHVRGATHASPTARAQALDATLARLRPFKTPDSVRQARLDRFHTGAGQTASVPR